MAWHSVVDDDQKDNDHAGDGEDGNSHHADVCVPNTEIVGFWVPKSRL